MAVQRILSRNADFQRLIALKTNRTRRLREGLMWVEGVRNINAAIAHDWKVASLLYPLDRDLSSWAQARIKQTPIDMNLALPPALHAELSDRDEGSELLALVKMRERPLTTYVPQQGMPTALFDRPANRGNLGSVIRSCDALGVGALLVVGHGVDLYDPETIVASMGSFFALPTFRIESGAELDTWIAAQRATFTTFQVVGTSAHGSLPLHEVDLTRPSLLMIGNETNGLSRRLIETCDVLANIPMRAGSAASSLNVASAATVLFYEAQRQSLQPRT